jgi:hypothetical protein
VSAVPADWGLTEAEKAFEAEECKRADLRLEAWGIWQRANGCTPRIAAIAAEILPDPEEAQPAGFDADTRIVILDEECEEVDSIISAYWINPFRKNLVKIALIEYSTAGPREVKAKKARMTVDRWNRAVTRLQMQVAEDLDIRARGKHHSVREWGLKPLRT